MVHDARCHDPARLTARGVFVPYALDLFSYTRIIAPLSNECLNKRVFEIFQDSVISNANADRKIRLTVNLELILSTFDHSLARSLF